MYDSIKNNERLTQADADRAGVTLKLLKQWAHVLDLLWVVSVNTDYEAKNSGHNSILLYNDMEITAYFINNKYIEARIKQNDKELLMYRYDGNDNQLVQVFRTFFNRHRN
jgi:hypothetical protein